MLPPSPYRLKRHTVRIHLRPPQFRDRLLLTTWSRRNCTSTNQSAIPEPRLRARLLSSSSGQASSGRSMRARLCLDRCNHRLCERSRGCRPRPPALLLSSPSGSFPQHTLSPIRSRLNLHRCTPSTCNRRWVSHRVRERPIRASLNRLETGLGATLRQIFGATAAMLPQHGGHLSTLPLKSQARDR